MKVLQGTVALLHIMMLSCCKATYPNSPDSDPPDKWASMSTRFTQHCSPFGISMFAQGFSKEKFYHACNVMAQYLDNDQDGCADDINVVKTMRLNQAGMGMAASASKPYYEDYADGFRGQDLYADETQPSCSGSSDTSDCRDAALEEILHLITSSGVSLYYSNNFGECYRGVNNRSEIQKQMDIARGGHFTSVPTSYPDGAVYTYDDKTCDYACMVTEMFYWGVTSLLGGQDEQRDNISDEWKVPKASELQSKLPGFYSLLQNGGTSMILLSAQGVLPGTGQSIGATGTYNPSSQICNNGCGLDGSGCGDLGNENDEGDQCADTPTPPSPPTSSAPITSPVANPTPPPSPPPTSSAPITSPVANPNPTPPSGEDLNGEEACEEKRYTQSACLAIGINNNCCDWNDNQCWSAIGQDVCEMSPTFSTQEPAAFPVASPSECVDSELSMVINNKNHRTCEWARKNKENRCRKSGVAAHCPQTCGECDAYQCSDSERMFITAWKKKMKSCEFVGANPGKVVLRCNKKGVTSTCRSTCGYCE